MSNEARARAARGRNSFVLYDDLCEQLTDLTDEEAGILFKAIYEYRKFLKGERDDEPDDPSERILRMVLRPIKTTLARDKAKYEEKCRMQAERQAKREADKKGLKPELSSEDDDSG